MRLLILTIILCLSMMFYFKDRGQLAGYKVCAPVMQMNRMLMVDYHVGYSATFTDNDGFVMSLFFNLETGRWAIIGYDGRGLSCIVNEGLDYIPIIVVKA